MGLRIGTNGASLTAQRHLRKATDGLNRTFERLSTGRRIARASDEAAGLAISARLRGQISSIEASVRNANDGVSLVQTAEGGLAEIQSSLTRMRELAVQAANGTLSASDRGNLDAEFTQLRNSIDQIAGSTDFNGNSLLGGAGTVVLQVGAGVGDQMTINTFDASATGIGGDISTLDLNSAANATTAITALDTAIDDVTGYRGEFGAMQNRLDATISSLSIRGENLAAANSRILDVDVAAETAQMTRFQVIQQSALSVLAQANAQPQAALSLLSS